MTRRIVITVWLFLILAGIYGQNELTIYVIPSKVQYDWSSPHSLYKSYIKNIQKNLFCKNGYILGHAFLQLKTRQNPDGLLTGMRSSSHKEPRDMILRDHYGLAILGADITGELESSPELLKKIEQYSMTGQLAFITVQICDEAAEKMLRFFENYKAGIEREGSPGARYGGAFWPRYENEGSGCSAFVVAFLDLAGILRDQFDQWRVAIDIPMDLIGGPYNSGNEVKIREIKKRKCWAGQQSPSSGGYEHFEIYDPTLIFGWIQDICLNTDKQKNSKSSPLRINNANGILIDGRDVAVPYKEPIFMERKTPSLFIDYYNLKYSNPN
jgi:hypothetical protein